MSLDPVVMQEALKVFWRDCPRVPVERCDGLTHADLIGRFAEKAAWMLLEQKFMRCTCDDVDCQANQISVKAWHLRWAWQRHRKVTRRARRARKMRRGWA